MLLYTCERDSFQKCFGYILIKHGHNCAQPLLTKIHVNKHNHFRPNVMCTIVHAVEQLRARSSKHTYIHTLNCAIENEPNQEEKCQV